MEFRIRRTSGGWGEKSSPCPGARAEGRDIYGDPMWWIEISTIDELLALSREVKEPVIVFPDGCVGDDPEIEIYDSYRE